jgi:hypothetical protein
MAKVAIRTAKIAIPSVASRSRSLSISLTEISDAEFIAPPRLLCIWQQERRRGVAAVARLRFGERANQSSGQPDGPATIGFVSLKPSFHANASVL